MTGDEMVGRHSQFDGHEFEQAPGFGDEQIGKPEDLFVQFFCVLLPPLLNIFCFCQVHTISDLYCVPCMKYSLGISNFLEKISSFSYSIVFLYFFVLIPEEGFLSLLAVVWDATFKCIQLSFFPLPFPSLLFSAICKASSDKHFAFLHFFFLGMALFTTSYTVSRTSVHSSSDTLSIISNPLNLFVTSIV